MALSIVHAPQQEAGLVTICGVRRVDTAIQHQSQGIDQQIPLPLSFFAKDLRSGEGAHCRYAA